MFTIGIDPEVIYPKIDKELLKLRIIEKEKYEKKEKEKKRKEEEKREKEKKREKGKKKNIIYEIKLNTLLFIYVLHKRYVYQLQSIFGNLYASKVLHSQHDT